jgi:hypothetical protein
MKGVGEAVPLHGGTATQCCTSALSWPPPFSPLEPSYDINNCAYLCRKETTNESEDVRLMTSKLCEHFLDLTKIIVVDLAHFVASKIPLERDPNVF